MDPELTIDLPPNITAWTGMDAVTHAMEALLVPPVPKELPPTGFHPLCDGAALQALRAINNNLELAVIDGKENLLARAEMQVAASLAGEISLFLPTSKYCNNENHHYTMQEANYDFV